MGFFNKQFWQMLVVAVTTQLVVLVIAIFVTSQIAEMSEMFANANETLARIESLVQNVTPEQIAEKADSLKNATELVGDGGANAVDKVGDAWERFKNR